MALAHTRPASRRQAELDAWLRRAADGAVLDLASLRGTLRAPTNLLQQLAEAILDSSVTVLPEGGLPELRRAWAEFEAHQRHHSVDADAGMALAASQLAAYTSVILGLVSPGRHVAVIEPAAPQVIEVVRRIGAMARTVSMRPTEWDFIASEFESRVGPQTELIVVADPNPMSGQYLTDEARAAILAAVERHGCFVLLDESARHSVVEEEDPGAGAFASALGTRCIRVDMPAAAILAQAASAAAIFAHPELIAPIRTVASSFGLEPGFIAQSVLARRFADGSAIDDVATLSGIVASGRALMLDGLDDIGVLGLGGPGGWYVPVRARALYTGTRDIGEALAEQAYLGVLPLAPYYVEGSSDPYILMSYLREAQALEETLGRLARFYESEGNAMAALPLPAPEDWQEGDDVDEEDADFEDDIPEDGDYEYAHVDDEAGDPHPDAAPDVQPLERAGPDDDAHILVTPAPAATVPEGGEPQEVAGQEPQQVEVSGAGEGVADPDEPDRMAWPSAPVQSPEVQSPEPQEESEEGPEEAGLDQPVPTHSEQKQPEPEWPEPERTAPEEPDPVDEMAEADAKYRAAMAGMVDGADMIGGSSGEEEMVQEPAAPETPDSAPQERRPRRDPVILPFGRWRRGRSDSEEQSSHDAGNEEPDAPEEPPVQVSDGNADPDKVVADDAAREDIPVFKLSVPDIASPNISAPAPHREPEGESDAGPDPAADPEVHADEGKPAEPATAEGDRRRSRPDRDDDRPFFFDDPVV